MGPRLRGDLSHISTSNVSPAPLPLIIFIMTSCHDHGLTFPISPHSVCAENNTKTAYTPILEVQYDRYGTGDIGPKHIPIVTYPRFSPVFPGWLGQTRNSTHAPPSRKVHSNHPGPGTTRKRNLDLRLMPTPAIRQSYTRDVRIPWCTKPKYLGSTSLCSTKETGTSAS
jgi:hypothetical protein